MLDNLLDKEIADEYSSKINTLAKKKADGMNLGKAVTLPLSGLCSIAVTCTNMHSFKEGIAAQPKEGKDLKLRETSLTSIVDTVSAPLQAIASYRMEKMSARRRSDQSFNQSVTRA